MDHTCVRFVEIEVPHSEQLFLKVSRNNKNLMASSVGYHKYARMDLDPKGFNQLYAIVHELMHVIGFEHMHQYYDRDKYVEVDLRRIPR